MPDLSRQMRDEPITITPEEVAAALQAQQRLDDYMAGYGAGFDRGKDIGRRAGQADSLRRGCLMMLPLVFATLSLGVMAGRHLDDAAANVLQIAATMAAIVLPFWLGRRRP
jgi:hypothetical protein